MDHPANHLHDHFYRRFEAMLATAFSRLATELRPDFVHGITVIKGTFADGNPLLAISNYVRNNRVPATAYPGRGGRGDGNQARSLVWIRDE